MVEIEMDAISRKYESFRLKNAYRERQLLSSIAEDGITEPLICADNNGSKYVLLDGYKRLRCLSRLKIFLVPVNPIGTDEQDAIVQLIKQSNNKSLQTLEQAGFVDELHNNFGLTITSLAEKLGCSPAWVSLRLGLIGEMSDTVKENIFSGRFPIRSYMYSLKSFTRVNDIEKDQVDRFVSSVSGKKLSTRDIDTLAYGYFRGGRAIREQIEKGNLSWTLKALRQKTASLTQDGDLNADERKIIGDLEILQKYISKAIRHLGMPVSSNPSFRQNALLLIQGLSGALVTLQKRIEEYSR
jgi:ParB/RepB/Spo0J family partition protein